MIFNFIDLWAHDKITQKDKWESEEKTMKNDNQYSHAFSSSSGGLVYLVQGY